MLKGELRTAYLALEEVHMFAELTDGIQRGVVVEAQSAYLEGIKKHHTNMIDSHITFYHKYIMPVSYFWFMVASILGSSEANMK